jgi:pilus assembly protein CpaC
VLRKRCWILAVLALVAVWPGVAAAQSGTQPIQKAEARLSVALNEGQLVQLDSPAASVFIANPEIADISVRSTRLVYVFGKKAGKTTLFALDKQDNLIASSEIVVEHNLDRLRESIGTLLPNSGIQVMSIDGAIILTGTVAQAREAEDARRLAARFIGEGEEIINQIAVTAPNQVNLRVRIAEVSRTVKNQFGFNWNALFTGDNFSLGLLTAFPFVGATTRVTGGYSRGDFDLDGFLNMLADDNLITILAEPNLTALSGETASFLAGGEFPIPVNEDTDSITIEFREFGVGLSFTPTILSGNRININVRPEVSSLDSTSAVRLSNVEVPGLTTSRAETTVELASGQTFAIAGLLQSDSRESLSKTPGIGDVPILGALFKSEAFQREETELVIIVTPYIVQPISDSDVPLPTDPFIGAENDPADDREAVAFQGATIPAPELSQAAGGEPGASGYLMD